MKTEIQLFSNPEFGEVRTSVTESNEPIFCLIDLCEILDQEFLFNTINRKQFVDYFFEHSKDKKMTEYLKKVLNTKKSA